MNKSDKTVESVKNKEKENQINKVGQTHNMKEEIGQMEEAEDVTKYGEFVSSYFAWLTLEKQKEKAKKMENIANPKEGNS